MSVATAGTPETFRGRVEPGPIFVVNGHRIPWDELGEVCVGAELTVTYDEPSQEPVRKPVDDDERERWEDAIELLSQCLPVSIRGACPAEQLAVAAEVAREGSGPLWELICDIGGWGARPPHDDEDLWTSAAMALVSVASDRLDEAAASALDSMELNEWLAMVIELVRCGPGSLADPDSLVALAARCLDVDSAAADPKAGPTMRAAFAVIVPIWRALGAVDASSALTPLGAWGIPVALARAWGGVLSD